MLTKVLYTFALSSVAWPGGPAPRAVLGFGTSTADPFQSLTHNAATSACEKGTQWEQALGAMLGECAPADAPQQAARPDVISYNAAISAWRENPLRCGHQCV